MVKNRIIINVFFVSVVDTLLICSKHKVGLHTEKCAMLWGLMLPDKSTFNHNQIK